MYDHVQGLVCGQ